MKESLDYRMHGLRVRSAVRLDAPSTTAQGSDIEIQWGERRAVPDGVPAGRLLARMASPAASYTLTEGPSGYLLRVPSFCEFAVDRARRKALVHLAPDAEPELASLLIGGFLAAMLGLAGHSVLHASAIEVGGETVAFVGRSGMGKTTIAALCCAGGARLVTDDVLRVEPRDGHAVCFSGSHALRLRPAAAELARLLGSSPRASTSDQRTAVHPAVTERKVLPLSTVIAPCCSRDSSELQIERLHGAEALLELLRFPRTVGWIDTDASRARRDLDALSRLSETVAVYRAELPWGPPFEPDLGRELLERIGIQTEAQTRLTVGPP